MKEQVIASRAPRRANAAGEGIAQRPCGATVVPSKLAAFSVRSLFGYVPRALKVVLVVLWRHRSGCWLSRGVICRALSGARGGRDRAPRARRPKRSKGSCDAAWRGPEFGGLTLTALSANLDGCPGCVARSLRACCRMACACASLNACRVAVVRTAAGHFVWVDDEGVALGEMKPSDQMPPFFIRGWNEDGTNEARQENSRTREEVSGSIDANGRRRD